MADILGFPHGDRPGDRYPSDVEPPCESVPTSSNWLRSDFLAEAHHLVNVERHGQYGDASINLANMEIMLDAFDRICRPDYPISAKAALRMALVKIARTQTGIHCRDNYTDACGYLSLAGEDCEKVR